MNREIRMVSAEFKHPKDEEGRFIPLFKEQMPATGEATHYMMYETSTEGTPISGVFKSTEELINWLIKTKATKFAKQVATYEDWMSVINNELTCSFSL